MLRILIVTLLSSSSISELKMGELYIQKCERVLQLFLSTIRVLGKNYWIAGILIVKRYYSFRIFSSGNLFYIV